MNAYIDKMATIFSKIFKLILLSYWKHNHEELISPVQPLVKQLSFSVLILVYLADISAIFSATILLIRSPRPA